MRRILAIVVWLACSLPALGENPGIPASDGDPAKRVAAMLRAAAHLDHAGLPDEAAQVRHAAQELIGQPRKDPDGMLWQKLAELEALRAEIARLRNDNPRNESTPARQIRTDIQIVQIDRTRLQAIGMDWEHGQVDRPDGEFECRGLESFEHVSKIFKALERNTLAKILAEPTVISVSGREVRFRSGGESPADGRNIAAANPPRWIGLETVFTATQVEASRFVIEGSLRVSVPMPNRGDGREPATRVVRLPHFAFPTAEDGTIMFDLFAAGGRYEDGDAAPDDSDTETLVLWRTQVVDSEPMNISPVDVPAPEQDAKQLPGARQLPATTFAPPAPVGPSELESPIEDSREDPPAKTQIRTSLQVVQIDRAVLRGMGLDLCAYEFGPGRIPLPYVQRPPNEFATELVSLLVNHGLANVVAEPTVVSTSGREARFHTGGEAAGDRPAGAAETEVVFTATYLGDQRIRIEGSLDVTTPILPWKCPQGATWRRVRIPHFGTERADGQMRVLVLFNQPVVEFDKPVRDSEGVATIVLLKTQLLDVTELAAPDAYVPGSPIAAPAGTIELPTPHPLKAPRPVPTLVPAIAPEPDDAVPAHVVFDCQLFDIDADRLEGIGLKWENTTAARVLDLGEDFANVFDALLDRGIAKELARPKLVNGFNRPVWFNKSEQNLDMPMFELTAAELDEGRMRLNWRIRDFRPPMPGQPPHPRRLSEIIANTEMKFGQTMLIRVLRPKEHNRFHRDQPDAPHGDDAQVRILLVTPHKVQRLGGVADQRVEPNVFNSSREQGANTPPVQRDPPKRSIPR